MPLFWWGLLLWAHWWAWADPHHLIVYLLLKLLPADGPVWVLLQLVVGPKEPCYWLMPLGSLACVLVLAHWWAWLGTGWLLVRPKESVPEWLSSCCWIKLGPGAWYQPVAWWVWILGKLIVGHDVSQSWFQHIGWQCWGPICSRAVTCLLQSKRVPWGSCQLIGGWAWILECLGSPGGPIAASSLLVDAAISLYSSQGSG